MGQGETGTSVKAIWNAEYKKTKHLTGIKGINHFSVHSVVKKVFPAKTQRCKERFVQPSLEKLLAGFGAKESADGCFVGGGLVEGDSERPAFPNVIGILARAVGFLQRI